MPFSDNAFTNSWLENTYSDPLFANVNFDNFDAAIGLADPALNQWGSSYLQQPLVDTYSSPTSDCEDYFSQTLPDTESSTQNFTKAISTQHTASKRRSSSIDSEDMPVIAPTPKRRRPSGVRSRPTSATVSSALSSSGKSNSARTPHNQVERKYRESLNTEMERLRLAVPATARWEEHVYSQAGKIKPSKAMILASAISYIHCLEKEMEGLRSENRSMSEDE
jgi:hypothetical protein